jgi:hypothetical protein
MKTVVVLLLLGGTGGWLGNQILPRLVILFLNNTPTQLQLFFVFLLVGEPGIHK